MYNNLTAGFDRAHVRTVDTDVYNNKILAAYSSIMVMNPRIKIQTQPASTKSFAIVLILYHYKISKQTFAPIILSLSGA